MSTIGDFTIGDPALRRLSIGNRSPAPSSAALTSQLHKSMRILPPNRMTIRRTTTREMARVARARLGCYHQSYETAEYRSLAHILERWWQDKDSTPRPWCWSLAIHRRATGRLNVFHSCFYPDPRLQASRSAGAFQNGDHSDRADVRLLAPISKITTRT